MSLLLLWIPFHSVFLHTLNMRILLSIKSLTQHRLHTLLTSTVLKYRILSLLILLYSTILGHKVLLIFISIVSLQIWSTLLPSQPFPSRFFLLQKKVLRKWQLTTMRYTCLLKDPPLLLCISLLLERIPINVYPTHHLAKHLPIPLNSTLTHKRSTSLARTIIYSTPPLSYSILMLPSPH